MEVTAGMNARETTHALLRHVQTEIIHTPTIVERNYPGASCAALSSKDVGFLLVGYRTGLSLVSSRFLVAQKDRLRDV